MGSNNFSHSNGHTVRSYKLMLNVTCCTKVESSSGHALCNGDIVDPGKSFVVVNRALHRVNKLNGNNIKINRVLHKVTRLINLCSLVTSVVVTG